MVQGQGLIFEATEHSSAIAITLKWMVHSIERWLLIDAVCCCDAFVPADKLIIDQNVCIARQVQLAQRLRSWPKISLSTWRKASCRKISFWTTFLDWWDLCAMQMLHFVGRCFIVRHFNQVGSFGVNLLLYAAVCIKLFLHGQFHYYYRSVLY